MEIRTTEFYARFYKKYNQYRDKLILAYLKRLRAKAKGPLTSQKRKIDPNEYKGGYK